MLWLIFPAMLGVFSLNAQVRISGRVTDQVDGSGLIGATVKEKGTSNVLLQTSMATTLFPLRGLMLSCFSLIPVMHRRRFG